MKNKTIVVMAAMAVMLFSTVVLAAAPAVNPYDNVLDGILDIFREESDSLRNSIYDATTKLFWLLATIDLAYIGMQLILKQADVGEIFADVIRWIFLTGLFLAFIQYSGEWPHLIIQSFRELNGSNFAVSPSNIFDRGLTIAGKLMHGTDIFAVGNYIARFFCSLVIVWAFVMIAATLLLTLAEMYLFLAGGIILLGFGGMKATQDIALAYMRKTIAIGVKLFALQMVVAIGESFLSRLTELDHRIGINGALVYMGVALVLNVLSKSIPDTFASMIGAQGMGGGGGGGGGGGSGGAGAWGEVLSPAKTMGSLAAGAVVGAVAAKQLATAQGATGFWKTGAKAAGNFVGALSKDLTAKAIGMHQPGSIASRMVGNMGNAKHRLDHHKEDQGQNKAPSKQSAQGSDESKAATISSKVAANAVENTSSANGSNRNDSDPTIRQEIASSESDKSTENEGSANPNTEDQLVGSSSASHRSDSSQADQTGREKQSSEGSTPKGAPDSHNTDASSTVAKPKDSTDVRQTAQSKTTPSRSEDSVAPSSIGSSSDGHNSSTSVKQHSANGATARTPEERPANGASAPTPEERQSVRSPTPQKLNDSAADKFKGRDPTASPSNSFTRQSSGLTRASPKQTEPKK